MQFVNTEEMAKVEAEKPSIFPPGQLPNQPIQGMIGLSSHIATCWQAAYQAKQPIETRLFDCSKRRKGEYDATRLAAIKKLGGVTTFLKHTGLKCRAAKSWIKDVIVPAGESPWGIDPTPLPDLPKDVDQNIIRQMIPMIMQGAMETGEVPDPDMISRAVESRRGLLMDEREQEARDRAKAMGKKIEDQFMEGKLPKALDKFIDDLTTFPSAILKGPSMQKVKQLKHVDGRPVVKDVIIPTYKRVSPFDFYPSPQCDDVNNGYLFERMRITREELERFKGTPGVNDGAVDAVLVEFQTKGSDATALSGDSQRATLENKDPRQSPGGTADDRIEVLEFWGTVPGRFIMDWGIQGVTDPLKEYHICAIKVGTHILKATLNPDPLGRRIYYVTSYEKVPDSIWGNAIPEIMGPVQDGLNAVVRALFDNIGFASGPQTIIDVTRLDPRQKATANKMWARKVWLTKGGGSYGSSGSPVDFHQPKLIADSLMRVLAKLEQLSDDHTGIPAYTYGNENVKGAGETASGLSMLMNAASKGIRQVIGNVGLDVYKELVEMQYNWNMLYLEDPSIKGDAQVNARGTLAEILKDQLRQDRMRFIQSFITPDQVMAVLRREGVARIVRATTEDLDIPGLVKDDDELSDMIPEGSAPPPEGSTPPQPGVPQAL